MKTKNSSTLRALPDGLRVSRKDLDSLIHCCSKQIGVPLGVIEKGVESAVQLLFAVLKLLQTPFERLHVRIEIKPALLSIREPDVQFCVSDDEASSRNDHPNVTRPIAIESLPTEHIQANT